MMVPVGAEGGEGVVKALGGGGGSCFMKGKRRRNQSGSGCAKLLAMNSTMAVAQINALKVVVGRRAERVGAEEGGGVIPRLD